MGKTDFRVLLVDNPISSNGLESEVEREYWALHNHIRLAKHFGSLSESAKINFGNNLQVNRGLLLIAQALLDDGINVKYTRSLQTDFEGYDVVGVSSYSTNFENAAEFARRVKTVSPSTLLVVGGPHATHEYLKELSSVANAFDVFVRDVGVTTMRELVQAVIKGDHNLLGQVNGIAYKNGNSFAVTPGRQRQDDSRFYAIAYELLPIDYLPVARIFFSMGCLSQCAFCANPRSSIIRYDVNTLSREIDFLVKNLGTELICVGDENFIEGAVRTKQKIELMNSLQQGAYWMFQTRVNQCLDGTLTGIDTSKCLEIALGIESSDNSVLKLSRKNITYEQALRSVDRLQKLGINVLAYFIVGLPGETEQIIRNNFDSMVALVDRDVLTEPVIFMPYPGTEIFRNQGKFSIDIVEDFNSFRRDKTPPYSYNGGLDGKRIKKLYLEGIETYLISAYHRLMKRRGISEPSAKSEPFSVAL